MFKPSNITEFYLLKNDVKHFAKGGNNGLLVTAPFFFAWTIVE